MRRLGLAVGAAASLVVTVSIAQSGCSLDPHQVPKTGETKPPEGCLAETLEVGDAQGHSDPFGAKAAGEARAGRIEASQVAQPAHGRQQIESGDFVLVNDKIAIVIEDGGLSDGYSAFGGEILAIDKVGDDGRMMGLSNHLETLVGMGLAMPLPSSVTVLNDGSDGNAAIVRVIGVTTPIPFLEGAFGTLFASQVGLTVAYDYVLEPGEEHMVLRISIENPEEEAIDLGELKASSDEIYAFFQTSHNQLVTPEHGFTGEGEVSWLGFVSGEWNFAVRPVEGVLEFGIEISGFTMFNGSGFLAEPCAISTFDRMEFIGGGPHYDGLREAARRVAEAPAWREISGTVRDNDGNPIAGAYVHELDQDDLYISRTISGDDGSYSIHAPPDEPVRLIAQLGGYPHDGVDVAAGESTSDLTFDPHGTIAVAATTMSDGRPMPVRIQVVPAAELPATPEGFGVPDERRGRLYQEFAMDGTAELVVPPGDHRVIVSRGYEWELLDTTVTVNAGETVDVDAVLEQSVDSTDYMCADFHIHSFMSADSSDPVVYKVRGAVADGLDIPVSSEHEWAVDFQPVIEQLGVDDWAYGLPSSELTTFSYGHFGVVPLIPRPGEYNNGAIDWVGKTPGEVFALVDAKPEQPALIVNHPSGAGFGAYFSTMLLSKETGEAGDPNWSDNFDAIEVFNDDSFDEARNDSVADWFALLNAGMKVFAVGNSDTHTLRSKPAGYPRTCFMFGHDDPHQLSHEAVRDAVLEGRGNVSGGLFLTLAGPGGELPGESVTPGMNTFMLTVESPSWIDATTIEIIVNGVTMSEVPVMPLGAGTSNRYVNMIDVDMASGDWVVFHVRGDGDLDPLHPGKNVFAVSNPIFAE